MSQICSKMITFLFSAYIGGHFCYHNNSFQINIRLLHLGYCSNKLMGGERGGGGEGGGGKIVFNARS